MSCENTNVSFAEMDLPSTSYPEPLGLKRSSNDQMLDGNMGFFVTQKTQIESNASFVGKKWEEVLTVRVMLPHVQGLQNKISLSV